MKAIPDIIKEISRKLRQNMTNAEKVLWDKVRAKRLNGIKIQIQSPIYVYTENSGLDRYVIPDFICFEKKVIIEVDGSIHTLKEVLVLDNEKEKLLKNKGFKVIRFTNDEIFNDIEHILEKISTLCSGKE